MYIEEYTTYQEPEVLALYGSVGWTAYTEQPEALRRGFAGSLLTLAARENGTLVGLLRAVGDGCTVVLVQDLLVRPDHQRRGIGTALMQAADTFAVQGQTAAWGSFGAMLLREDAGGYVLVGVVSFAAAATITALCFRLRNRENRRKDGTGKPDPQKQEGKTT